MEAITALHEIDQVSMALHFSILVFDIPFFEVASKTLEISENNHYLMSKSNMNEIR